MKLTSLVSAGLLLAATAASHAAVIVTLPTATTDGSVVIDAPISFNITSEGYCVLIAFDEWVTADASATGIFFAPDATLSYTINDGLTQTAIPDDVIDNLAFNLGDITTNDGFFYLSTNYLRSGDLFIVLPCTLVLPATEHPNFNPAAAQTFTGNLFIANGDGIALTGLTPAGAAVPEPSAALLSLLGAGLLVTRRRMVH